MGRPPGSEPSRTTTRRLGPMEDIFWAAAIRQPMRTPMKPAGAGATYLPAAGTDVAGGMTEDGLATVTTASAQK
jgi:hypothetical protein